MEQQSNENLFGLEIDEIASSYFRDGSKWARFVSIVFFCVIGFVFICMALASTAVIRAFSTYFPGGQGMQALAGAVLVIVAVVLIAFLIVSVFMFRAATSIRKGIDRQDQNLFNEGL